MNFFTGLRSEIVAWGKREGTGWLFVLKTVLAVLLAMGISLRLELGQPVTAMVTVFVIMQPQSGLVLTKSFYRICGTVAGTAASLVLLGLFAQERMLFLPGLALWIGLCAAGAALYRNFKSYGFTLAGYTAAMIALPLVMQPTGFFDYAVNRTTEVIVGIICAGVVSDGLFPRSLGESITRTIAVRYSDFLCFTEAILSGVLGSGELDRMHLKVVGNAVTLESLRSSVLLEATNMRAADLQLRRLNGSYLAMSTTLHSGHQLLDRLRREDAPAARALTELNSTLAELVAQGKGEEPQETSRALALFRESLPQRGDALRKAHPHPLERGIDLDLETGLELLGRFAAEFQEYLTAYRSLAEEASTIEQHDEVRFTSRTDPAVALLTGARAALVTLLAAFFWIASAWPNGASAVMMAAIGCALFAPAPDPARAVKMGLFGTMAGFAAAFVCKFFVLTSAHGFSLLCLCMVPFLLVGPFLSVNPKLAGIGLGYSTMFCFMISPANRMQYDPVTFVNFGSALMLGLAAASLVFATFAPVTGRWLKRRTARMLRRQVEIACFGTVRRLTHRFESGTRDLLQRLPADPNPRTPDNGEVLDWTFVVLEVGRAVIHLRQDAASLSPSHPLHEKVRQPLEPIARLFARPSAGNRATALQAVELSRDGIRSASEREGVPAEERATMRRMLTSLHFIRSSILDEETALAAAVAEPQGIPAGEPSYAA